MHVPPLACTCIVTPGPPFPHPTPWLVRMHHDASRRLSGLPSKTWSGAQRSGEGIPHRTCLSRLTGKGESPHLTRPFAAHPEMEGPTPNLPVTSR
eukprot:46370-Chlamydomonas_euryale.AAC.1